MGDLLQAISVLLVFLTFLFQAIDKEISSLINTSVPDVNRIIERKRFKDKLGSLLILKSIPICIVYTITSYTLLPKSISIIHYSKLDFWNFDPLSTIFVFIECGSIGLTFYAVNKMLQLGRKFLSFEP